MNTERERTASDLEIIERASPVTKLDDTAASLEQQLQREKDHRCEERFIWIFAVTMLCDAVAFPNVGWASTAIIPLELIFLIAVARWLGVDWVVVLFERLLNKYVRPIGRSPDEQP